MPSSASPLVSVVIASHNRAGLLQETIDSVRGQTYPNVEIIVVNDASTDGTQAWLDAQPDIESVHLASNVERSKARNAGIERAKGEFVTILDDDDLWEPHALAKLASALTQDPGAVAVVSGFRYFDGKGNSSRGSHPWRTRKGRLWRDFLMGAFAHHGRTVFRTELLKELGGYGIDPPHEDRELWLRVARCGDVIVIPDTLMRYRVHAGMSKDDPYWTLEAVYRDYSRALEGEEAVMANRYVDAGVHAHLSHEEYDAEHAAKALRHAIAAAMTAPRVLWAPLVRPSVPQLLGKSLVAIVLRPNGMRRVRNGLRRIRNLRMRNPLEWRSSS